jgi:uncharacterized integral membrane protein
MEYSIIYIILIEAKSYSELFQRCMENFLFDGHSCVSGTETFSMVDIHVYLAQKILFDRHSCISGTETFSLMDIRVYLAHRNFLFDGHSCISGTETFYELVGIGKVRL